MNITEQLEKLKEISLKNKEYVSKISEEINAIEEALNNLCILNDITLEIGEYILSYERSTSRRYRLCCEVKSSLEKRTLIELPVSIRIEAYKLLPLLLEEIYNNQISIKNIYKD